MSKHSFDIWHYVIVLQIFFQDEPQIAVEFIAYDVGTNVEVTKQIVCKLSPFQLNIHHKYGGNYIIVHKVSPL